MATHSIKARLIGYSTGKKVLLEKGKIIWETLLITGLVGVKKITDQSYNLREQNWR